MVTAGLPRIIALQGEVGLRLLPEITASVEQTLRQKPARLVIDFSKVSYVDCSILALLISGMHTAAQYGGKVVLAGVPRQVRRALASVRIAAFFPTYRTVQAALADC